jgi:2-polyprenyl-6-hydroxyphenyl methylase/3-demethylubiquinone-9 3-methyltransferase
MSFFDHKKEINKFDNIADFWWNKNSGPFKILHKINPIRSNFIFKNSKKYFDPSKENLKIIDIGCGGGILTESLLNLFCKSSIIGVDAGIQNIITAKSHSEYLPKKPEYIHAKFENFAINFSEEKFDIICAIEIIEHVEDWKFFLDLVNKLLKPNGLFFLSTLNRNFKSYILGIIIAEYIFKYVPRGTHLWKKFLKPSEIINYLSGSSLYKIIDINGIEFNPCKNEWNASLNLDVNYIACFQKFI